MGAIAPASDKICRSCTIENRHGDSGWINGKHVQYSQVLIPEKEEWSFNVIYIELLEGVQVVVHQLIDDADDASLSPCLQQTGGKV